jgi:hypothetical protein
MVQNYKINQRTHLSQYKDMMKCLNTYVFTFESVMPSVDLQRQMPLWHHPGEDKSVPQGNNGAKAKCLWTKHTILTVGEGVDSAARLLDPSHDKMATCPCDACDEDREKGCTDPHVCAEGASKKINLLHPEWDPRKPNIRQREPEH